MKTILLKFSGPLQSWGTDSHFETRHTDMHPSKSAVIGLVAASLGLRRDSDEDIRRLNELNFAVRIDQAGVLERDYHTAHKYKPNGTLNRTYVTNRYYVSDAVFVVAISHEDSAWIEKIADALKNPYFQQFLGRRAFPLTADFYIGIFEDGAINILLQYPWQASKWYQKRNGKNVSFLPIYADSKLGEKSRYIVRKDNVVSFSQKDRRFGFRTEIMLKKDLPPAMQNDEHDAFGAIEG